MQLRPITFVYVAVLVAGILLAFHGSPHAHSRIGECGFWGPMSAGMSCQ